MVHVRAARVLVALLAATLAGVVPSPVDASDDPPAADISQALARAAAAVPAIPDENSRVVLTRAIGLARVRVLLKRGDLAAARQEATTLVYRFRDEALMSVAFAQVDAGDVDGALATAGDIGGAYSPDGPIAYVAWAVARRGDTGRARAIARTIRVDASRVLALGDIAVAQAEAGDPAGAVATAGELAPEVERAVALADIALARFRAGARSEAAATLAQAASIVRGAPASPGRNYALMVTALVHAQMREFAAALSLAALGDRFLRHHIRWQIAIAQAAVGDAAGALKTDGSLGRKGYLAVALAEGGYLDGAREALTRVGGDEDRIEAQRHVALVLARREQRDEAARLFRAARRIAAALRDPFWRACRMRKVAASQAAGSFVAAARDSAAAIGDARERRRAFREIAQAQAASGHFTEATTWATAQPDPVLRAASLLGAAEGALQAAGFVDAKDIKVNRYGRWSRTFLDVAC